VKTVLASLLIALGTVVLMSSEASAWYCRASSPSAWGWGSGNYSYARSRALAECAVRTPRWQTCYIRYCR
jgi:hypothetical protein